MKNKIVLTIIAGVVLTAAAWTYGAPAPAPQKWEYRFQTECNQEQANSLGFLGWELVGMDPSSSHRQCIFKKPMF